MPAGAALAFVDHHLVMAAERPRGAETRDTCADDGNSHGCPRMNLRRSFERAEGFERAFAGDGMIDDALRQKHAHPALCLCRDTLESSGRMSGSPLRTWGRPA